MKILNPHHFLKAALIIICTLTGCAHVERVALSVAESARSGSQNNFTPSDNGTPKASVRSQNSTTFTNITFYANGSAFMQQGGIDSHSCEAEIAKLVRESPQIPGVFLKCENVRQINALPYSMRVRDEKSGRNNEIRFKNKEMCTSLIGFVSSFSAAFNPASSSNQPACN